MSIEHTCGCGKVYVVAREMIGRRARCKACGTSQVIIDPAEDLIANLTLAHVGAAAADGVPVVDVEVCEEESIPVVTAYTPPEDDSASYGFDSSTPEQPDAMPTVDGRTFSGALGKLRLPRVASCLAYGPHLRWALAGQGPDVRVLNMKAGKKGEVFPDHDADVTALAVGPDARHALSGDEDGTICYWNLETVRRKRRLRGHDGPIQALAFAPSGRLAVSAGADGAVRLWDLEAGAECDLTDAEWDEAVTTVAFARDGRTFLAGGSGGRLQAWSVKTGRCVQEFRGDGAIAGAAFNDDAGEVVAFAAPGRFSFRSFPNVWRWDARTGKFRATVRNRDQSENRPLLGLLDARGKRLLIAAQTRPDSDEEPDDDTLRMTKGPYCLELWSLATGARLEVFERIPSCPIDLAVAPENTRAAVACEDGTVRTFSLSAF